MSTDFQSTLKALGKRAKKEAEARAEEAAVARRCDEDNIDFAKAVGGVTPLKDSRRHEAPRDCSPIKPRPKEAGVLAGEDYSYVGSGGYDEPPALFGKNGQGKNDTQRLRNGHYPVAADVGLHGYMQEEAQQILNEFIEFTEKRGVCGEIIHDSGLGSAGYKPVLKNMIRRWLMQHPDVLAYVEPRAGNDGVVRILLKRSRREEGQIFKHQPEAV